MDYASDADVIESKAGDGLFQCVEFLSSEMHRGWVLRINEQFMS